MLVGLSYSRCVKDIVLEKVDPDDVLVIVTRTMFDPTNDEHWNAIWDGYISSYIWADQINNETKFKDVTIELYHQGKLHQPRMFYKQPYGIKNNFHKMNHWLETVYPKEVHQENAALKQAWERYQILSGLHKKSTQIKFYDNF